MTASGHAKRGGKKYATYRVGSTRIGPRYESTPPLTHRPSAISGWKTMIATAWSRSVRRSQSIHPRTHATPYTMMSAIKLHASTACPCGVPGNG
jgi:hypothetical protein